MSLAQSCLSEGGNRCLLIIMLLTMTFLGLCRIEALAFMEQQMTIGVHSGKIYLHWKGYDV